MILYQSRSLAGLAGFRRDLSVSDLANLAGAGSTTLVFDLGEGWRNLRSVVVSGANLVTSAGGSCRATFSDDGTATRQVNGMTPNSVSGPLNYTGDLATMVYQILVAGRFLRVALTNGATGQGATAHLQVVGHD